MYQIRRWHKLCNAFPTNMPAIGTRDIDYKKKQEREREREKTSETYNTRIYRLSAISTDHFSMKRISKADET